MKIKQTRTAYLICGLSLAALFATGCASSRPKVESVSARLTNIDLEGVELVFDVHVLNSLPLTLRTPGGRYALQIADSEILSSDAVPPAELPGGKTAAVSLPARIEYSQVWRLAQGLRDAAEVNYLLKGALTAKALGQTFDLPFEHRGQMPVLRVPQISIVDVRTEEVSLRGARVEVQADITNPNIFALGISDLGYMLKLGEVSVGEIKASTADVVQPNQTAGLSLAGSLTGMDALTRLMGGQTLGRPSLSAVGSIQTPYGPVEINRSERR